MKVMEKSCARVENPRTIREWLMSDLFWKNFQAIAIGGILGYLYFHFEGTSTPPASGPLLSIITGAFLGFFFVNRPCGSC